MNATQDLIDRIMGFTPEQFMKFITHPEVIAIMNGEQTKEKATT